MKRVNDYKESTVMPPEAGGQKDLCVDKLLCVEAVTVKDINEHCNELLMIKKVGVDKWI